MIVYSLVGAGVLYIIWKFYLGNKYLQLLKRFLTASIAEATGELQALQAIAKDYDVGETLAEIEGQLNSLVKEINRSPLQKIDEAEDFNDKCIEITDRLIDLCDEPERYFKKITDTMEG